jgi:hypothetical protein
MYTTGMRSARARERQRLPRGLRGGHRAAGYAEGVSWRVIDSESGSSS